MSPAAQAACSSQLSAPSSNESAPSDSKRDPNYGRFAHEFCVTELVRHGIFADVFRARHRADGHVYAVERRRRWQGPIDGEAQLCEARALAAVASVGGSGGCSHVLRYFSSWLEDGRLHLQTEFSEFSLRDRLVQRTRSFDDPHFPIEDLTTTLRHAATGLAVLHGRGFAHLDMRPENILVGSDGCYKIAGLALAVAFDTTGPADNTASTVAIASPAGDRRYLAQEAVQGGNVRPEQLPKLDVFSLGLICYEIATLPKALPADGPEWYNLREGHLNLRPPLPNHLTALVHRMVHTSPKERPCSEEVARHQGIAPEDQHIECDAHRVAIFHDEVVRPQRAIEANAVLPLNGLASSAPPTDVGIRVVAGALRPVSLGG